MWAKDAYPYGQKTRVHASKGLASRPAPVLHTGPFSESQPKSHSQTTKTADFFSQKYNKAFIIARTC
jgi:hypothetical protein